ncbi:hypothetical protein ACFVVM_19830 [Nocardia sp. NPDC058176]|uniref:hypothetical protein n=1 Tax=Nocardia sp. NPDC058176 TaxID=3346368 RepID=UPI0036DC785D
MNEATQRLAVAAAMVFQVGAQARAGLRARAACVERQARLLLAEGEIDYLRSVRDALDRGESVVVRGHGDDEIDRADRRWQSLIAAIARHRLDEDERHRRSIAAVDEQERLAERLLREVNRGDLCANRPTVVAPGAVRIERLLAAQELAVHELRLRLGDYVTAVEASTGGDR